MTTAIDLPPGLIRKSAWIKHYYITDAALNRQMASGAFPKFDEKASTVHCRYWKSSQIRAFLENRDWRTVTE